MKEMIAEASLPFKARMGGVLYLIIIIGGLFGAGYVPSTIVVHGDAAATVNNILANESLYRFGLSIHIIVVLCNIPLAVIFYDLFELANKSLSRLVMLFILVAATIEGVSLLNQFVPLILLQSAATITAEQLQATTYMHFLLQVIGFNLSLAFFGCFCLLAGYLIFRLGVLPRIIGLLLAIGGACYLINSFANFLVPEFAVSLSPYIFIPCFLGEATLCLSLLIKGVSLEQKVI
ncbi:hypothetical protein XM38_046700 [Halomicronema hongdechloris C2206]|uniref:DUF4386 domain-containing protein n=1 Tax=Halomicronema hongdechloris C2206 TaxID=1641165 RepID=A0A1Z3HTQ3_9CYAN|nr:DUF4386 domain-containing protein [Halomicronema hongdechloris]ASC73698.1 hypothetical protein XM38_046700 [Halomicronema hongdechloris C2206]